MTINPFARQLIHLLVTESTCTLLNPLARRSIRLWVNLSDCASMNPGCVLLNPHACLLVTPGCANQSTPTKDGAGSVTPQFHFVHEPPMLQLFVFLCNFTVLADCSLFIPPLSRLFLPFPVFSSPFLTSASPAIPNSAYPIISPTDSARFRHYSPNTMSQQVTQTDRVPGQAESSSAAATSQKSQGFMMVCSRRKVFWLMEFLINIAGVDNDHNERFERRFPRKVVRLCYEGLGAETSKYITWHVRTGLRGYLGLAPYPDRIQQ